VSPQTHPDPEELLAHAAGSAPDWVSLVVACHLTLCERCRNELVLLDDLGAALLESVEPQRGNGDLLGQILATPREPASAPRAVPPPLPDPSLPRVLLPYFAEATPRWRFLAPGVRHIPLKLNVNGTPVRLIRFRPGYVIPEHSHTGRETLLVFNGTIGDSRTGVEYARGDLCRSDTDTMHEQPIGDGAPCISLVVAEGKVRPTSWVGRALARLTGV
jgi:putative transcriptional regulator